MKCQEAHSLIAAERDEAVGSREHAQLEVHLAECEACRRIRIDLAAALESWRAGAAQVATPNAEHEWLAVRRRLRSATQPGDETARRTRNTTFAWFALPLAAAAAIALALFFPGPPGDDSGAVARSPTIARADSIEVPGGHTSTMVFIDDKSGWLIVWATDAVADGD